jgi:hypothetical protein
MFETIPAKREMRWGLMRSLIQEWMRPLTVADHGCLARVRGIGAGNRLPVGQWQVVLLMHGDFL